MLNLIFILSSFWIHTSLSNPVIHHMYTPTKAGAKNEKELSRAIFNALKSNNFASLENYIPGQSEIDYLKSTSSRINKPLFEPLIAESLKENTEKNFREIIQKGIEKEINWSGVQLSEHKITKCHIEKIGCSVKVTFQDPKGNSFNISYDLVKIRQKWFLFQGIRAD